MRRSSGAGGAAGRLAALLVRLAETVRQGLRQLAAYRLRTALALSGIVVGVGAVTGSTALLDSVDARVRAAWERLGGTQVGFIRGQTGRFRDGRYIRFPKSYDVTAEDAVAIRAAFPEIAALSLANAGFEAVTAGRVRIEGWVVGAGADYPRVRPTPIAAGRYFTAVEDAAAERVIVLMEPFARELFGRPDPIGEEVQVLGQRFTVIGVASSFGGRRAIVPHTTTLRRLGRSRGSNVSLRVAGDASYGELGPALVRFVVSRHPGSRPEHFRSFGFGVFQDRELKEIHARGNILIAVALLCLLAGSIGILNVLLISVTERTREIGLRIALGASPAAVRAQFLLEALLLCGLGGALGIAAARAIASGFARVVSSALPLDAWNSAPLTVALGAKGILLGAGLGLAVALVAGVYPAVRASRLDPAESLRHES